MNVKDSEIKGLLEQYKHIAVYGLSPDVSKPSHYVPLYMQDHGWKITGIYPKAVSQSPFQLVQSLAEVPEKERKFLDVFRASEKIPELVEEVLKVGGVEVLWLQLGIRHPEAEARAEAAGIKVVSDRCLIIEHRKYF